MSTASPSSASTPRQRRVEGVVPEGRLLGIVLLTIGAILAARLVFDGADRYTLLGVSLASLAGFAASREYGFAIPAGFTGGLGTAILAITSGSLSPANTPAVLFLSVAGGFVSIWLLGLLAKPREVHPWPLVPAVILGAFGASFAAGQPGAIEWIQIGVAAVIVAAGVASLVRTVATSHG